MTDWSNFSTDGATSSRGSGVDTVFEVDQTIHLFPFPVDLGPYPKAVFIHLTDLNPYRIAEVRVQLEDARKAWPHTSKRD